MTSDEQGTPSEPQYLIAAIDAARAPINRFRLIPVAESQNVGCYFSGWLLLKQAISRSLEKRVPSLVFYWVGSLNCCFSAWLARNLQSQIL